MAGEGARDATIGFFLFLMAAFVLLAGFVFLIGVIYQPSVLRLVLAVAVLLLGGWFVRAGHAAFRRASNQEGATDAGTPGEEVRAEAQTEVRDHGPGNDP